MSSTRVRMRRGAVVLATILLLVIVTPVVSAHETREVGDFELTVGFANEPAYVDELNGVSLSISRVGDDGEPVVGADQTLDATIIHGEESKDVELRSVFGEDGAYVADVMPTSTGTYSFQFTGEIEGQEIDETFRSGPDTFSDVEDREAIAFPGGTSEAGGDSDQSMALGIAGIVAGLLGLVAGVAGYLKASGSTQQSAGDRRPASSQQASE